MPTCARAPRNNCAYLNDRPIATEVTQYVCRLNGPLASLEALSRKGNGDVISSLAEIDAEAVLALLERILKPLSYVALKNIGGEVRRRIVAAIPCEDQLLAKHAIREGRAAST